MLKKIRIRKIETEIPYDVFVSSIDGLISKVDRVNLLVYFTSKKIYELEDTMFVLLNMYDNSGEMSALLVGNRDADFQTLVQNIRFGLKYRIAGNVSILTNDEETSTLPFIDELNNSNVFCIYALQCYSDTFLGVNIDEFNINLDLQEQYDLVSKYSDYLKSIDFDKLKDMKVSCYSELVCLLIDGTVLINGVKQLNNVGMVYYINNHMIVAIGNDNTITCLTKKDVAGADFINDNNCKYKKILATEFGVIALTNDGIVRYFGDLTSSVIDYSRFVDVDDIQLDDDIVVIKDGKSYSLFHIND